MSLLSLFGLAGVLEAQAPIVGPDEAIGFDYADADRDAYQVTHFENSYDEGAWLNIGQPPIVASTNGVSTYRVAPTPTQGTHTISFRACNAVGASIPTTPFAFARDVAVPVKPPPPTGVRVLRPVFSS
jgi:hypothetical protein